MNIAISGTHYVGKTTVAQSLLENLNNYNLHNEAYILLQEEGYEFSSNPNLDEYILQLEKSIEIISTRKTRNNIFDRCPIDILAYIKTHENYSDFDYEFWKEKIIKSINHLDLVVFIPIETPDILNCPESHNRYLRQLVDTKLHDLIYDITDSIPVLEISGNVQNRINTILNYLSNLLQN